MPDKDFYHEGMIALQDQAGGRAIADLLATKVRHDVFSDSDRAQIATAAFFFIATCFRDVPDCSIKAGTPGFVKITGPNTLEFPDYDGNLMFRTLGNISKNPNVGLLFVTLDAAPKRLRISGTARFFRDPGRLKGHLDAKAVVEVTCSDIYPNCPRYIPNVEEGIPSVYLPKEGVKSPAPQWKTYPFVTPLLPPNDIHKDEILAAAVAKDGA
ncbi:pyridoxamine 5'-phosphate oxidase family protein [Methylovirgula sp. HY1]|uniref:pyridoxamine 5'-phosphate oxidase family protein n=1 Tax=Methylovirgula sp. HY1 TaxID=2822761 RepID=UPI001C5B33A5|nr:pyridoxamine 5'-phosphate oxidase family protein [Methylovirgula sp. HY1]QXX76056.1 hypothetical protein MHY1_02891 [Methylovirgula sp. HY1]